MELLVEIARAIFSSLLFVIVINGCGVPGRKRKQAKPTEPSEHQPDPPSVSHVAESSIEMKPKVIPNAEAIDTSKAKKILKSKKHTDEKKEKSTKETQRSTKSKRASKAQNSKEQAAETKTAPAAPVPEPKPEPKEEQGTNLDDDPNVDNADNDPTNQDAPSLEMNSAALTKCADQTCSDRLKSREKLQSKEN